MAFSRTFPNQHKFECLTLQEAHALIVRKEKEGFEMIKPVFPIERNDFHSDDGRIKWVVIMRYEGREADESIKTS